MRVVTCVSGLAGAALLLAAAPAVAQQATGGRVATSAAGEVGQRRTRDVPIAGVEPMARVNNRIQNRVQSRLRTRIDRDYDPEASAASPFEAAAARVRSPTRARR